MTVVVGYIPTAEGSAAIEAAVAEARLRNAALVVVNVSRGEALVDERYADEEQLDQVRATLEAAGVDVHVRQQVDGHSPAAQIIGVAEEEHADLVVIGIRQRSPVGKFVFGSTAQEILIHAHCPVLAVKPPRS